MCTNSREKAEQKLYFDCLPSYACPLHSRLELLHKLRNVLFIRDPLLQR